MKRSRCFGQFAWAVTCDVRSSDPSTPATTPTRSRSRTNPTACPTRCLGPRSPFTVEIKSSRRPANSRTPVPALVDRARTEPLFQDLLLRGNQEAGQDRRPAQEAARSEAHQVLRLASSVPGPVQTADRPTLAQDNLEGKAAAPEPLRSAAARFEPRQGRVLPDLLSLSPAGAPLSPEAEKHSAPHRPKVQERVEPDAAEMLPGLNEATALEAGNHGEPAEMEVLVSSDPLERTAVEQGGLPTNPSPEITTSSELGSSKQGRHSRAVQSAPLAGERLPLERQPSTFQAPGSDQVAFLRRPLAGADGCTGSGSGIFLRRAPRPICLASSDRAAA